MNERRRANDTDIIEIKTTLIANTKTLDTIISTLNGKDGLVTDTALTKQSVSRAWKILYFLLFSIVGLAIKVVAF
jgi:hypothetical protein